MTADEFNSLEKEQQKFLLCDADKIGENRNETSRREIFKIEDLLIEVEVSNLNRYRREITAYSINRIPE